MWWCVYDETPRYGTCTIYTFFLGTLQPAYAFNPFQTACTGAGTGSTVCKARIPTTDPLTGPNGIIIKATNIIAYIGGIAAVILVILGGIRYITSAGDAGNAASAKNTILYALVGIIVIALAKTIIGFVISKT